MYFLPIVRSNVIEKQAVGFETDDALLSESTSSQTAHNTLN